MKVNAAFGKTVRMVFTWVSNPEIVSNNSWEFVNENGVSQNLPSNSSIKTDYINFTTSSVEFNFTSAGYYGNYSFNLINVLGSAIITFQVIPEG